MTYRGHVEGGVVVLDEPVRLPDGTQVKVEPLEQPSRPTLAEQFADIIGAAPDLPEDMAENHDRYIHGAAKP
jgi:hypothetical protein